MIATGTAMSCQVPKPVDVTSMRRTSGSGDAVGLGNEVGVALGRTVGVVVFPQPPTTTAAKTVANGRPTALWEGRSPPGRPHRRNAGARIRPQHSARPF